METTWYYLGWECCKRLKQPTFGTGWSMDFSHEVGWSGMLDCSFHWPSNLTTVIGFISGFSLNLNIIFNNHRSTEPLIYYADFFLNSYIGAITVSWFAFSMRVGWQHILHLSWCKVGENNRIFGYMINLEGRWCTWAHEKGKLIEHAGPWSHSWYACMPLLKKRLLISSSLSSFYMLDFFFPVGQYRKTILMLQL